MRQADSHDYEPDFGPMMLDEQKGKDKLWESEEYVYRPHDEAVDAAEIGGGNTRMAPRTTPNAVAASAIRSSSQPPARTRESTS